MVVAAAAVAGSSRLLAPTTAEQPGRSGPVGVGAGVASQCVGVVMALVTAAKKTLLEQADFGFEFVDALLQLLFAFLQACRPNHLVLGSELLEFRLASEGALVETAIVAGTLPGVVQCLAAGREHTGRWQGAGVCTGVDGFPFHPNQYGTAAGPMVGW